MSRWFLDLIRLEKYDKERGGQLLTTIYDHTKKKKKKQQSLINFILKEGLKQVKPGIFRVVNKSFRS